MSVWDALAEDYKSRARFYDAANLVGAYVNAGVFEDKSLTTLSNRVALVNFLTDGTLDISGAANSKNHLEFMKEILDVLQKYKGAGGGNEYDKQLLNKSQ